MRTSLRSTAVAFGFALAGALSVAPEAGAFCGFYVSGSSEQLTNGATRVALMRQGMRTVLSMSNDYQGPPQDFAMVVPVPVVLQQEQVRTLPHDVFDHLERLTAPRLVEYWEQDPCRVAHDREANVSPAPMAPGSIGVRRSAATVDLGVRVEASFSVGEYQVVILSATQSTGLETWLRQERYNIPQGAAEYLAPYVRAGSKFFVARVNIGRVQRRPDGSARLSPLRFHYDSQEFRLPVRLGLLNAPAQQDLIVYLLHPTSRFETANYRTVTIPTNLDVDDGVRGEFGAFYAQLFDRTLAAYGGRAVVTEYAWTSASCDPCPTPPLGANDLMTLGADAVLAGNGAFANAPRQGNAVVVPRGLVAPMVVTRLHTRYDRATLTEDLVFREAPGIAGGREHTMNANREIEQGSQPSPYNNFQARYAIRHAWTGPIACENPVRNVWGGPPSGQPAVPPQAAQDLASAPRGRVELARVVRTPVPDLNLTGAPRVGSDGARTPVRVRVPGTLKARAVGALVLGALGAGALAIARRARARRR